MAQSSDINTAVKVGFDRIQHELQTSKDIISGLFINQGTYRVRKFYMDFMGKYETDRVANVFNVPAAGDPARGGSKGRATPARKFNLWRRRELASLADDLHIETLRAEAQTVALPQKQLMSMRVEAVEAAFKRASMRRILDLIVTPHQENPNLLTGTAATTLPFLASRTFFPKISGAAGALTMAQLTQKELFHLNANIDNMFGVDPKKMHGMRPELDKVKRVWIMSNSAWADFQHHNFEVRGHKDFFGKDIQLGGYGTFRNFQDTMVVCVPDEFLPIIDAATSTTIGRLAAVTEAARVVANGRRQLQVQAHDATTGLASLTSGAAANSVGLHQTIFMNPRVFSIHVPENLQVPKVRYDDKDNSFEESCYALQTVSGIRRFDQGVCRVLIPQVDGQPLTQFT